MSERIAKTAPLIDVRSPRDYLDRVIRTQLLNAVNEGMLAVGPHEISRHVRIDDQSKQVPPDTHAADLVGGRRNNKRREALADLRTPDGGWLSFSAVLRPKDGKVEVVAYNVERVYRRDDCPHWIRFDFSPPGHDNDQRGMRSHVHPGDDDLQLPAPIFAPHELIALLLDPPGPSDTRKPRAKGEVERP
ncbi:MAG: hypothetical protein AAGF11_44580 [Myxococcota bacterium]